MDSLDSVLKDLQALYTQLSRKLLDPNATDTSLSRKSISQLSNKIYPLIDSGQISAKQAEQNKNILLRVFNSHATNYLNNHLIVILVRCQDEQTFATAITQGWHQYQRFVFTYNALLIHAKQYYEKQSVNLKLKNQVSDNNKLQFTVLPVPALGLKLFNQLVLARFHRRLQRAALSILSHQRQRYHPEDDRLRTILSIYWSCSLRELARMSMSRSGVITFWKEKNKQITHIFKDGKDNQQLFRNIILTSLSQNSEKYYDKLYWSSLRELHAWQLTKHLDLLCSREQTLAEFHLPSEQSMKYYLSMTRNALLGDLQGVLTKPTGFKYVFMNCAEHLQEIFPQALLYFSLFKRIQQKSVALVCRLLTEAITEKGAQINSKISKPRQYITCALKFKKAVRKIFDEAESHCLQIQQTMEKQFKKLLQSLECSKALAQFSDFTIKECVRLKLDDEGCENKFRQILFLLASVSAKDSFLLHYQEYLARRLLESVNQPRTDIQNNMLRLLGEQVGNIAVTHHLAMVKDIEKSIQTSQQLHNRLPFISYKWDLRVFNPSVWPQSANKQKYSAIEPPSLIKSHTSILQQLYHQHFGVRLKLRLDRGTSLFEGKFTSGKVKFQAQNIYLFLLLHLTDQSSGKAYFGQLKKMFLDKKVDQKGSPLQNLVQVLVENRLVTRQKNEGPLEEQQTICLNYQYRAPEGSKPQIPIIIKPSPALMKSFTQSSIDQNRILKQRQKLIDAMLVKLLKHANATKGNCITFQQLYEGIYGNNFLKSLDIPQSLVKQRLQYLIVKEFCKRDDDDRRVYHYIA